MINKSELELRKMIKEHQDKIKELEEAIVFTNSHEGLVRADIKETGTLRPKIVNRKLKNINLSTKSSSVELELVASREGRVITCTITSYMDRTLKGVGKAVCKIGDKFDYDKGLQLAEIRARKDLYANIEKRLEARF